MISQTSDFFNRCAFDISILNIKILPFLLQTFYGEVYSITGEVTLNAVAAELKMLADADYIIIDW